MGSQFRLLTNYGTINQKVRVLACALHYSPWRLISDVANLHDLKEMWQACYADAVGGMTPVATQELDANAVREEQLQAKELTSRE